jgi:hypothetical protein
VVVSLNFAEVCTDAGVATGFEGVCDGEECVAMDVVAVSGWAVQVALYEAEGARTVCEEVGAAYLEAYVYASKLSAIDSVGGRGRGYHDFDAGVRGGVVGGCS